MFNPDYNVVDSIDIPDGTERVCLSCSVEGCECDSFCLNCGAKIYGDNATGCHSYCGD